MQQKLLTHSIYSHTYLFFSILYFYNLSSTDSYFPNKRERMKEISHCPLHLKMSDVCRKAHLNLIHCFCLPFWLSRSRKAKEQPGFSFEQKHRQQYSYLHWHHGGRGRGKDTVKGRMIFYSQSYSQSQ